MLNPTLLTGAAAATDKVQPALTPVTTPNMILFLTKLPASKAAGVGAIRVSHVTRAMRLEELDPQGNTIIGFSLTPYIEASTNKVAGIAVTQIGSSWVPAPFTSAQLSAIGLITNELKQFQASFPASAKAGKPAIPRAKGMKDDVGGALGMLGAGIACGLAAGEGGLNLIADIGCLADFGAVVSGDGGEGGAPDPAWQNIWDTFNQVANTPLPGGGTGDGSGNNLGASDGAGGGDDGGGGSGGGEGPDDTPTHRPF